jgi:NAD(P)-dependent dehydrogenase (short-subunit alcohol dehydrogenase family)
MPSIPELFSLAGRVAIVTGGSRGLGEEMSEGLAEAGAALMSNYITGQTIVVDGGRTIAGS